MTAKALLLLPMLLILSGCGEPEQHSQNDYHVHADFRVIANGHEVDFNKSAYMSTPYKHLYENVHLHDSNPNVIHFHSEEATLRGFFESLGMQLSDECFSDGIQEYCNSETKQLKIFVNNSQLERSRFASYKPHDLDQILIHYGTGSPTREMLDSVTKEACIYSEKCPLPKGFVLPPESCSAAKPCVLE